MNLLIGFGISIVSDWPPQVILVPFNSCGLNRVAMMFVNGGPTSVRLNCTGVLKID